MFWSDLGKRKPLTNFINPIKRAKSNSSKVSTRASWYELLFLRSNICSKRDKNRIIRDKNRDKNSSKNQKT